MTQAEPTKAKPVFRAYYQQGKCPLTLPKRLIIESIKSICH